MYSASAASYAGDPAGGAWSGFAPVSRVEVSTDEGTTWVDATLERGDAWAWQRWHCDWTPTPGRYVLSARATDATGRTQPIQPPWNRGGFANNLVQRVDVTVLDG